MLRALFCAPILFVTLFAGAESYSPAANHNYPSQVYWGDTHVHTSFSTGDAYLLGQNVVTPTIAYDFAKGRPVTARNGMQVRIRKPLDFLVIADHAEGLGVSYILKEDNPDMSQQDYSALISKEYVNKVLRQTAWQKVVERAEQHNEPGKFTAFAGYEWSSPGAKFLQGVFANLHRVVIFRDDADKTSGIVPFSAFESRNPEDLWAFLAQYEQDTGGEVIAIPHNSNLSNGEMFSQYQYDGSEIDVAWAKTRA